VPYQCKITSALPFKENSYCTWELNVTFERGYNLIKYTYLHMISGFRIPMQV
jgi:hypothetical protein